VSFQDNPNKQVLGYQTILDFAATGDDGRWPWQQPVVYDVQKPSQIIITIMRTFSSFTGRDAAVGTQPTVRALKALTV